MVPTCPFFPLCNSCDLSSKCRRYISWMPFVVFFWLSCFYSAGMVVPKYRFVLRGGVNKFVIANSHLSVDPRWSFKQLMHLSTFQRLRGLESGTLFCTSPRRSFCICRRSPIPAESIAWWLRHRYFCRLTFPTHGPLRHFMPLLSTSKWLRILGKISIKSFGRHVEHSHLYAWTPAADVSWN